MTQENDELLLRDLCARLPYDVKGIITYNGDKDIFTVKGIYNDILSLSDSECCHLEDFRPYLFPLSSMTEEQWKEITDIQIKESLKLIDSNNDYMSNPLFSIGDLKTLDWCYANHIDYRGLIPMGLAIDATGLNIY